MEGRKSISLEVPKGFLPKELEAECLEWVIDPLPGETKRSKTLVLMNYRTLGFFLSTLNPAKTLIG